MTSPNAPITRHPVPDALAGSRLDAFVADSLELPRRYAQRLIARGRIEIEGRPTRKGSLLRVGDVLRIGAFRHPREGMLACGGASLRILRQDEHFVAVDKPAGTPTHPLDFDEVRSVANAALECFPELRGVGYGPLEPGLVHRLDTGTSGVLLFARSTAAFERARGHFDDHSADKRYVARVHGRLDSVCELRLGLEHHGRKMRVVRQGGQLARSVILPLRASATDSLVEIDLRTGVRHQIRVSLAHLGHPILGDALYGSDLSAARYLLHARRLAIPGFEATSEPPPEFATPLVLLREQASLKDL